LFVRIYWRNDELDLGITWIRNGQQASVCAQVAEVEVDPVTGQVRLRRFTTSHSTGTVINPLTHQGQIDGGVVMDRKYCIDKLVIMIKNIKIFTAWLRLT